MVEFDPVILQSVVDYAVAAGSADAGFIESLLDNAGLSSDPESVSVVQNLVSAASGGFIPAATDAVGVISSGAKAAGSGVVNAASGALDYLTSTPTRTLLTLGTVTGVTAFGAYETFKPGQTVSNDSSAGCSPACTGSQVCSGGQCSYPNLIAQVQDQGAAGALLSWFGTGLLGKTPAEIGAWVKGATPWVEGLLVVGGVVVVAYTVKSFIPKGSRGGEVIVSAGRRAYRSKY